MKVLQCRNVNSAYTQGLALLRSQGVRETSRAGDVLVMPCPVTTVYERPTERVLLDPVRDANPFFHLFEALWMIAGRRDATWLDRFVKDFSSRFAEDDGIQHGAYGYRWRQHFDMEGGGGRPGLPDQLETAVQLLRANPQDRRVVLQMWDPVADLGVDKRDVPCNLVVLPRVRSRVVGQDGSATGVQSLLDITVFCRSNDLIWGLAGANAVHFSVLLEYLAGRIGAGIGTYTQVSQNYHAYVNVLEKMGTPAMFQPYEAEGDSAILRPTPMGNNWDLWDQDLTQFMEWADSADPLGNGVGTFEYHNDWFRETADPLYCAHWCWKRGYQHDAFTILANAEGIAPDWRLAAQQWFERRMKGKSDAPFNV